MRITTFLLLVCVCSTFAISSHSQNARVTINKIRVPLEEVLDEIENQTDYLFLYNASVDINRETTVKVKNKPVGELLDQLFKRTDLEYELESTHILLTSRQPGTQTVTQQTHTVSGTVTDESGEPVIGANIVVKGQLGGVISDINGQFTIQASPNSTLTVSYIGFMSEEIPVNNRTVLRIVLLESSETLNEVVVVGYGVQKKVNLTGSVASVKAEQIANRGGD